MFPRAAKNRLKENWAKLREVKTAYLDFCIFSNDFKENIIKLWQFRKFTGEFGSPEFPTV